MKLKFHDSTIIELTLSERNLLSLLTKCYIVDSARTLESGDVFAADGEKLIGVFRVVAEKDEDHYEGREYPPGKMHPTTEAMLSIIKQYLVLPKPEILNFNQAMARVQEVFPEVAAETAEGQLVLYTNMAYDLDENGMQKDPVQLTKYEP